MTVQRGRRGLVFPARKAFTLRQRLDMWWHENVMPASVDDKNGLRAPHMVSYWWVHVGRPSDGFSKIIGLRCTCGESWTTGGMQ